MDNSSGEPVEGFAPSKSRIPSLASHCAAGSQDLSYQGGVNKVKTGKILVFVNLGYSKLDSATSDMAQATSGTNAWSVDQTNGKVNVNFFGTLNLNGNDIINVSKIIGMDGKWKIDSDGTMMAVRVITDELIAKNVKAETLCIGSTCITEAELLKLLGKTPQNDNLLLINDNLTATTTDNSSLIIDNPITEPIPADIATSTEPVAVNQ